MKKIKIIGVGGTISSISTEKGLKPRLTADNILNYIPIIEQFYEIEIEQLLSIDSANLQPEDWITISEAICDALNDVTVHGVVVTHGTDTMAFSAAAVSIFLRNITKPVVFTGSQIPLEVFSSDAQRNLIDAIRVAGETDIAESVIVFNSKVFRGCRTIKLRESNLSAFETIDAIPIAEIDRRINILDHFIKTRNSARTWFDGNIQANVALIKVFPGLDPVLIEQLPSMGYKGVVIEGYGSGNVPSQKRSLIKSIKKLRKQGFPVVISSVCIFGRTELHLYEPGKLAEQAGAISAYDMISEVALIKLMWALSKTDEYDKLEELIHTNLAGEISQLVI